MWLTGEVCKDGMSCSGSKACDYASIGMISQGYNGTRTTACSFMAYEEICGGTFNNSHRFCPQPQSDYPPYFFLGNR